MKNRFLPAPIFFFLGLLSIGCGAQQEKDETEEVKTPQKSKEEKKIDQWVKDYCACAEDNDPMMCISDWEKSMKKDQIKPEQRKKVKRNLGDCEKKVRNAIDKQFGG